MLQKCLTVVQIYILLDNKGIRMGRGVEIKRMFSAKDKKKNLLIHVYILQFALTFIFSQPLIYLKSLAHPIIKAFLCLSIGCLGLSSASHMYVKCQEKHHRL